MGDILDELRSPSFPIGQRFALCQEAADEIEQLRARVERAEADADRLAEALRLYADHSGLGNECPTCVVLDLHDKEVEAR